jgi:poly(A) polymerase/tRNA nucleotidyltransferase (CCA-adding enzyme)
MALLPTETKTGKEKLFDPFGGKADLKKKIIKAVGNPQDRFSEDALRMMRAVRFASALGFEIEKETEAAIKKNSADLAVVSKERIRDEFVKIVMSDNGSEGVESLRRLGLLGQIIPELEEGCRVGQNKHHIYDCYTHSLLSLKYAVSKKFNLYVRLAALLHDIAKPRTKAGEGPDSTFYTHEIVGAKMAKEILTRLRFAKEEIKKIVLLVRYHLFYYNVGEVSESSVRRLLKNVGLENIDELLQVRMADRIGSGAPKAEPYKLRHLKYLIEKVSQDPIDPKMLAINGIEVMSVLKTGPGPKIGQVLAILLSAVLSDPKKNDKEFLLKETERLGLLSESDLADLNRQAKSEVEHLEIKRDEMAKSKYWVT